MFVVSLRSEGKKEHSIVKLSRFVYHIYFITFLRLEYLLNKIYSTFFIKIMLYKREIYEKILLRNLTENCELNKKNVDFNFRQ